MFPLLLLLAAESCRCSTVLPSVTVLRGSVATLPCAHRRGDVTWSRLDGSGARVPLVTIRGGLETQKAARFSSLADNSLVITNVVASDSKAYLCNDTAVYLQVTTDPNQVVPGAGNQPVTKGNLGPDPAAGLWRVPVGVMVGAVLVLSGILTVRFCSKHASKPPDRPADEALYEEVRAAAEQPAGDSYFESPYYSTSISEVTNSCTDPSHNNLYSSVSRLPAEGAEECVYSLAQHPLHTGNNLQ